MEMLGLAWIKADCWGMCLEAYTIFLNLILILPISAQIYLLVKKEDFGYLGIAKINHSPRRQRINK